MSDINTQMAGLTQALDVPLAPQAVKETFDPMDPKYGPLPGQPKDAPAPAATEEGAGEEDVEAKQPGNFNKALQREQRARADMERNFNTKIDSVLNAIKGLAPTAPKAAGRIETLLQQLNGDKGAEFESLTPGITEVLKGALEEIQELRSQPKTAENTAEIQQKMALLEFESTFANYPKEYKKDFIAAQRAAEERGKSGESLQGYMEAWFENYLSTKGEADSPPAKTAARSTPSRGIVPAGSTAHRAAPNPREQLWAGRGGNIAGVKFRK